MSSIMARYANTILNREFPIDLSTNNYGQIGEQLERRLGLEINNRAEADIPDEGELKVKMAGSSARTTLMHCDPDGRSIVRALVTKYGQENEDGEKRLSITMVGDKPNNLGFSLRYTDEMVILCHNGEPVVLEVKDQQVIVGWTAERIRNRAAKKLHIGAYSVEWTPNEKRTAAMFTAIHRYDNFKGTSEFVEVIRQGGIVIEMTAYFKPVDEKGKRKFRNRGVKFRMHEIGDLFEQHSTLH